MKVIDRLINVCKNPRFIVNPFKRIIPNINGIIHGNAISAFWYRTHINFGDQITPYLLKYYGFTPVHYPLYRAEVLTTGSILQQAPEDYSGNILGSGLINDISRPLKNAKIWAVRGKYTRERICAPSDTQLGDPGLLASRLYTGTHDKTHALGIIPHFSELQDARIHSIAQKYPEDILIINPMRRPTAVFSDINRCENIVSSSLHGIISSDSFNIPNAWMYLSDKVEGAGFKFNDYFSSLDVSHDPLLINGDESLSEIIKKTRKPPEHIEKLKIQLDETFIKFRESYFSKKNK